MSKPWETSAAASVAKKPVKMGRGRAIFMMSILVWAWGFDFIAAKKTLEALPLMPMVFLKLLLGLMVIVGIKLVIDRRFRFQRRDVLYFAACALFGEVGYYLCEYNAIGYMPVSLVSVILAFVPGVSIIIEKVIFKRKATKIMVGGIIGSVLGVAMVIGVDFEQLLQGRLIGYLLSFGAIICWNAYNFFTVELHKRYNSLTVIYVQLLGGLILSAPIALHQMPPLETFTPVVIGGLLYLGVVVAGICALATVKALHALGPTATSMFSNLLPITTTFFGWLLLNETISPLQMVGGGIIIIGASIILREKGKLEGSAK